MLRWLLGFLALVTLGVSSASAQSVNYGWQATVSSGTTLPPPGTCNGYTDPAGSTGCANAPPSGPYTFQDTNVFPPISGGVQSAGSAQLSGQTYATTGGCAPGAGLPTNRACHPPWPVPGVDYPVGPSCGTSCGFHNPGGPTDPTISANLPTGCTYASFKVTCSINTNYSLGPFDFTAAGNSSNTDITISLGGSGACTLHDSIFNFDIAKTPLAGITVFSGGCGGGMNFNYDSFKVHNSSTGSNGVFDNGSTTAVFFSSSQGTGATAAQMGVVTHFNHTYFQTCPARCVTPESALLEYTYFGGLHMYSANETAAVHGDGWGSTWDDLHCSCSNIMSHIEQYDLWIVPPASDGGTTCIPCGNIQAQDSNFTATFTKGQASINVTTAATYGQIGDFVYTGTGTYMFGGTSGTTISAYPPWPSPQITSFPSGGVTATGTFGVSQRWVSISQGSAGGSFYAPATMTQTIDHNVYITNITQASYGSPNPSAFPLSRLAQGSNAQSNLILTNNYIDTCGIGTGTANPPCATPGSTYAPYAFTGLPTTKLVIGNNVIMGNGNCLDMVTSLMPCGASNIKTVYPAQANFSPSSDTNVSVLGVSLKPNGTPTIVRGAKSTTVGGAATFSASPTVGNAIIVGVTFTNGGTPACNDNAAGGSNTYTQQNNQQGSSSSVQSYIFTAPVTRTNSGFAVTCTASGATAQKTVAEEASGVATSSGSTDPTELYGQNNFQASVSGANNATSTPWPRKSVPVLIWGVYFGGASSMTYGSAPFPFTSGPAATQGGGVFTEYAVQ